MNKKGFTIIELLTVMGILVLLLLISVPIYKNISDKLNESLYQSKVSNVLSRGEEYAEKTGNMLFDISTLISEGILNADGELSTFLDPRNGRSMLCDIVSISFYDNQYDSELIPSDTCYSSSTLNDLYGMIDILAFDQDGHQILNTEDWQNSSVVTFQYKFNDSYLSYQDYITDIYWSGEEEIHCSSNYSQCDHYVISTSSIKDVMVKLQIKVLFQGKEILLSASKRLLVDLQAPYLDGEISYDVNSHVNYKKPVTFSLSDGSGSGIKGYSIINTPNCNKSDVLHHYIEASNGIQTVYLENGRYYLCIIDQVDNLGYDYEHYTFEIQNVDLNGPDIDVSVQNVWGKTNTVSFAIYKTDSNIKYYGFGIGSDEPEEYIEVDASSVILSRIYSANGTYNVWAIDVSGNKVMQTFEVKHVDLIKPEAVVETPHSGDDASKMTQFTLKDSESGIDSYAITTSKDSPSSWTLVPGNLKEYSFSQLFSSNGTYYLWVKDKVGWTNRVEFKILNADHTGPSFSVVQATNWVKSDKISVTIHDLSGVSFYQWSDSSSLPNSWISANESSSYVVSKTLTSNQTIYLHAKDSLGNTSYVKIVESYIDTTLPVLHYTANEEWTNEPRVITLSASDSESGVNNIYYRVIGDSTWQLYTGPFTITKGTFYAYVYDNVMNHSEVATYYSYVDMDAPYTAYIKLEDAINQNPGVSISCDSNESHSYTDNICHVKGNMPNGFTFVLPDYTSNGLSSGVGYFLREVYEGGKLIQTDTIKRGSSWPSFSVTGPHYTVMYLIDNAGNKSPGALIVYYD